MKYISIDTETCQILSIGLIIEDTEKQLGYNEIPKLHIVIPHKKITGEPYALNLNKDLIELINSYHLCKTPQEKEALQMKNYIVFRNEAEVARCVSEFLLDNNVINKPTIAGKNYLAFDSKFLNKIEGWASLGWNRRVIDPAVLFMDWNNDAEIPSLDVCKKRAGIEGVVTHNAVEDAFDVIELLRSTYERNNI